MRGESSRSPSRASSTHSSRREDGDRSRSIEVIKHVVNNDRNPATAGSKVTVKQEPAENLPGVAPLLPRAAPQMLPNFGQVRDLPRGENGGVDVHKVIKSPMYSVAAMQEVLMQDAGANEIMQNFMRALPFGPFGPFMMAQQQQIQGAVPNPTQGQQQEVIEIETERPSREDKKSKKGAQRKGKK